MHFVIISSDTLANVMLKKATLQNGDEGGNICGSSSQKYERANGQAFSGRSSCNTAVKSIKMLFHSSDST